MPRYLYVEKHMELKETVEALHVIGEIMGIEKWTTIVYDTVRRWARAGEWEIERQAAAGLDLSEPVPAFWLIDDDILRRRTALAKKLQEEAMTAASAKARAVSTRLYAEIERDLENHNTKREFFANRDPQIIMEAVMRLAVELTGGTANRDEIMERFGREYKAIAARRELRVLPKGAIS